MARRPVIGVTGPDAGGGPAWFFTRLAVFLQGGRARRITPKRKVPIEQLDALIIGGGADINPELYGEKILRTIKSESRRMRGRWPFSFLLAIGLWLIRRLFSVDFDLAMRDQGRDDLEFDLLRAAVERNMPVLGICRGGQLINVHFGGTLYQDISEFYVEKPNLRTVRARKTVMLEPGSELARLTGRAWLAVNSLHHQSVKTPGKDLRIAAREKNGVIQAIEHPRAQFLLGVQWHPEFLPLHKEQRRLFRHLVAAAKLHHVSPLPMASEAPRGSRFAVYRGQSPANQ